ncbi:dephospho-CoA kinase [Peteryoungia ipomoeae]|uniref:Dephospho-CoA kinase n=1 Tax=Peteryoungia ipomoeae TaxID=1210932 RepID=A0A4S8NZ09_9HYPH|nr:dephospho-CoA kinase [Peteryoungia ipomoeae]THV22151.1 dephospho-CoA kinase [Peteryoungia ipomoeae]
MIIIGLTGSIGMGKSTTAALFAAEGVPVNDADQVVHDLYRGLAVPLIEAAFPGVATSGEVDRQKLVAALAQNPANFSKLESIVHPMVREHEREFLRQQAARGTDIVLLDIPLLFETAGEDRVDVIVVVSCDASIQRQRVLSRPGMTPEKFELILARQLPDAEKRIRADYIIDTGHGIEDARRQVQSLLAQIRAQTGENKDA